MKDTSERMKLQQYRVLAIDAQLEALTAQCEALKQLSIEHNHGRDLGANGPSEHFLAQAVELVAAVKHFLADNEEGSHESYHQLLRQFEENALQLKEGAGSLSANLELRARTHLETSLAGIEAPRNPADFAIVPEHASEMRVHAHVCCYQAETGQMETFVSQLRSLCNLCLETVYTYAEHKECTAGCLSHLWIG